MRHAKKYFEIVGRLDGILPDDYEARQKWMAAYLKIRRLALKHHRLAEFECNGEGSVRGKWYRCDGSVKGAYLLDGETTIFTAESDKVEKRIEALCKEIGLTVEFQGDPRGGTVHLTQDGKYVEIVD